MWSHRSQRVNIKLYGTVLGKSRTARLSSHRRLSIEGYKLLTSACGEGLARLASHKYDHMIRIKIFIDFAEKFTTFIEVDSYFVTGQTELPAGVSISAYADITSRAKIRPHAEIRCQYPECTFMIFSYLNSIVGFTFRGWPTYS